MSKFYDLVLVFLIGVLICIMTFSLWFVFERMGWGYSL